MDTVDVAAPAEADAKGDGAFIYSVAGQVDRIFESHRSGHLVLQARHREALEQAGHILARMRAGAGADVGERIDSVLARVAVLLGVGDSGVAPASPGGRETAGRSRRHFKGVAGACALFVVMGAGLGGLAAHNYSATSKWRHLDRAQAAVTASVTAQLKAANANVTTLNGEVRSLTGQLSAVQGQLSSVANQKEKAIDQQTVLEQLVVAASAVANDLDQCISASDRLQASLDRAVAAGPSAMGAVGPQAAQVSSLCGRAEAANQMLQSALPGGS